MPIGVGLLVPANYRVAELRLIAWIPTVPPLGSPSDYEAAWRTVVVAATDVGRDPSAITPSLRALMVVAPTTAAAEALLRSTLVRYWALAETPGAWWNDLGLEHPFGPQYRGYVELLPERIERRQLDAAIRPTRADIVRSCYLHGTPRDVERQIRAYADAGLRHIVLAPISALVRQRHQNYAVAASARLIRRLRR